MTDKNRILIVEDQQGSLNALEHDLNVVMPKYIGGFSRGYYEVSRCYNGAYERISNSDYWMILLDHRMPREDQGNLEQKDFEAFCDTLEQIGYGLISLIKKKNPETIILGTSSLDKNELREFPKPDYVIRKSFGDTAQDLETLMEELAK